MTVYRQSKSLFSSRDFFGHGPQRLLVTITIDRALATGRTALGLTTKPYRRQTSERGTFHSIDPSEESNHLDFYLIHSSIHPSTMLAADKLSLQSSLKQQATALKEKEFNLHHSNFMTVGTQAAVLAGLDITMFIEFTPPDDAAWHTDTQWIARPLKMLYYAIIVGAFCANMIVVSQTTALSVLGAGLALRGPDGSMMTATEGLYEERSSVFKTFAMGLALTVGSVLLSVWLLLHWEAAAVCFLVALWTARKIYRNYRRVQQRFDFDESETVDFTDIFNGPAAIRVVPHMAQNVVQELQKEMGWMTASTLSSSSHRASPDDEESEEDVEEGIPLTRRGTVKNRRSKS